MNEDAYPSGNQYPIRQRLYLNVYGIQIHSDYYQTDCLDALYTIIKQDEEIKQLKLARYELENALDPITILD